MEKVGFLRRLVAYIIDAIIVGIVNAILNSIFRGGMQAAQAAGQTPESGAMVMALIGLILMIVWSVGYFIFFWTRSGQTIGKKIMGIKVVATDGGPVTVGKAILRLIGYVISGAIIYLGFLWIIWDANKQGWHDKIAGTYVVRA